MLIIMLSPNLNFLWLIVGVLCLFCCTGDSNMCVETDKQALLKLKHGLIDELGILSTWKSEVDCCEWRGVSCSNLTGHVTMLDLFAISGNIDSSLLCDLQHLTYLNLSLNNFRGSKIPECIGSLGQLRELRIFSSLISGRIPRGLQNLSNLQILDLSNNDALIVNDFGWISHLPSLRYLDLSSVNLSQVVDWQSSLSKVPHLSVIRLKDCALKSHVNPTSFVHTNSSTSLEFLDVSGNVLDSSIQPWLSNISNVLKVLDLSDNVLEHIFPNSLNMNSLKVLKLGFNALHLISPRAFSNMNSLKLLDLQSNSLRHIPSNAFTNTSSLEHMYLDYNELENSMLRYIANLCQWKTLGLSNNRFSGQVSDWIPQLRCAQDSIEYLDLSGNPFSGGSFPDISRFSNVKTLNLENTSLHGSISQSFEQLPYLSKLSLGNNNLTGPLPVFTGLRWLMQLDLSNNRLNGPLPVFTGLKWLMQLDLSNNRLNGPLPVFTGLKWLMHLDLSNNRLNGNIHPSTFENVPNLVNLHLSSNGLNSVINETHLSNLSNLSFLELSNNLILFNFSSNWVPPFQLLLFSASSCNFGPQFPRWLKYQRELDGLDISNASISDSIPQWLWQNSLHSLNLSHNKLYGELPELVSKIGPWVLDLSFNNLSGPLPYFPPNAKAWLLANNMFSGNISFICATFQRTLYYLDISSNYLSGKLPDCWEQIPRLMVLRLENNYFSGAIPDSVGNLNYLASIHLNNNNLSGTLPSLMNSSHLLFIDFGQNKLNGMLQSWIGQYLPNLIGLRLKGNKLKGTIPTSLCNLSSLQILDLSKNNITGDIPHCFGNLSAMSNMTTTRQAISYYVSGSIMLSSFMDTAELSWKGVDVEYSKILGLMKTIDLSCNHLNGEIPGGMSKLMALASLNLSRNHLKGPIPINMGQMKRLESLDLSHNSLSGEIPISFSSLSFLSVLNLSFNNLSGKIPTGTQLQTFNASSYMGNQGLCGPPLIEACPDQNPNNPHSIDANGVDSLISFGFYVSMGLGFIFGFWGVCGALILKSSWRRSFFGFFQNLNDWTYVRVALLKAKIKRRFQD